MSEYALQIKNISKSFKLDNSKRIFSFLKSKKTKFLVLDEINFSVEKGEVVGIIGLNGSGKTTLLRIIAGVYQPDNGTIVVNGRLSPLMQLGAGFHEELDAKENIILNGMLLGIPKKKLLAKSIRS